MHVWRLKQNWLEVREESIYFRKSSFVLVSSKNVVNLSKYGDFVKEFLQKKWELCHIFPKKTFVPIHTRMFWLPLCEISPRTKSSQYSLQIMWGKKKPPKFFTGSFDVNIKKSPSYATTWINNYPKISKTTLNNPLSMKGLCCWIKYFL
jgi:hypothetical protein